MCWLGGRSGNVLHQSPASAKVWLRYHSNAALASLRRELAIKVWLDLPHQPPTVPAGEAPNPDTYKAVERALTAYDMFVIGSDTGNFEDVRRVFNRL